MREAGSRLSWGGCGAAIGVGGALALLISGPVLAADGVAGAPALCAIDTAAPIAGMAQPAPLDPQPVVTAAEARIASRGDRSAELAQLKLAGPTLQGVPLDYAVYRALDAAGRPVPVSMLDGSVGPTVAVAASGGSLLDAIETLASAAEVRWRFDGTRLWLVGTNEWRLTLPASRDLAAAARERAMSLGMKVVDEGEALRVAGTPADMARLKGALAQLYANSRFVPVDVSWYLVAPERGRIGWETLVDRTDAVEAMVFDGGGLALAMAPGTSAAVEAFLAREGRVELLGSQTAVVVDGRDLVAGVGCGERRLVGRGLQLAPVLRPGGKVTLRYAFAGGVAQKGEVTVGLGSTLVVAGGEAIAGRFPVAVLRPRLLEVVRDKAPVKVAALKVSVTR